MLCGFKTFKCVFCVYAMTKYLKFAINFIYTSPNNFSLFS